MKAGFSAVWLLSLRRSYTLEFIHEPGAAQLGIVPRALYFVGFSSDAALGGCVSNEVFSLGNQPLLYQIVVFLFQMIASRGAGVPGVISKEAAFRSTQILQ